MGEALNILELHFQFPLWDTSTISILLGKLGLNLSIPFMGYIIDTIIENDVEYLLSIPFMGYLYLRICIWG